MSAKGTRGSGKMTVGNHGYLRFLDDNGNHKLVHRVITELCVPNPENKPYVNHKNGNKLDNRISNLEWVTSQENNQHAWDTGLKKKMMVRDFNGQIFPGINEAAEFHNYTVSKVYSHIKNRVKNPRFWIVV